MNSNDSNAPVAKRLTVFLSYARGDQAQAVSIVSALEAAGHTVQWDALLAGGSPFAKAIENAIQASDVVLVAWSKQSIASDWVLDEAQSGRDLKKLVPVTLDGTQPPLGFGQYHAVDLRQWRGSVDAPEFSGVLRGIAEVTGRASLSSSAPPAAAPPIAIPGDVLHGVTSRWSRRQVLGVSAAVAGAVTAVAWRAGLLPHAASTAANSIAVLPFANLSGDPQQAYFSDGVAEEVRAVTSTRQGVAQAT